MRFIAFLVRFTTFKTRKEEEDLKLVVKTPLMMTCKGWWSIWWLCWLVMNEAQFGWTIVKGLQKWFGFLVIVCLYMCLWELSYCEVFKPGLLANLLSYCFDFGRKASETFELIRLFILHSLNSFSWAIKPSCVCTSRTWLDSLWNHASQVHNVDIIEAFIWIVNCIS